MFQIQEEKEREFITNHLGQSLDTFGEIKWTEPSDARSSRYVKISSSVNLEKLQQLFHDHWLILQAELLVYVTGQIEDDASELWEKIFYKTFFSSAHTTVAITNGTYSNLTQALAKAIQSRWAETPYCKSSLLGIPIWQQIYNKEQLIGQMNEGKYTTEYTSLHENETTEQEIVPLARNHEYYALLDVKDCERADETRVKIISALKEYLVTAWTPEFWTERTGLTFIPSLHLIVGGNIATLIQIDTLIQDNQIIAVVNWKGASALLCDLLRKMPISDKDHVKKLLLLHWPWLVESELPAIIDRIMRILDKSDLIQIIEFDNFKQNFYDLIIKIHGKTSSIQRQLSRLYSN